MLTVYRLIVPVSSLRFTRRQNLVFTAESYRILSCTCILKSFQLSVIMSSDESCQKLAGHPPAVKAGGMRITQHKIPHAKDTKESTNEDLTGLGGPNPLQSSAAVSIAGAPNKGNADFTPEAAQVAHSPKPPSHIHNVPRPNIQQPRK